MMAVACLLGTAAGPAFAAEPAPATAYALPETETWDLASDDGQPYRILVSRPDGEVTDGGFPIIFVIAANAMFAAVAEARPIQGPGSREIGRSVGRATVCQDMTYTGVTGHINTKYKSNKTNI